MTKATLVRMLHRQHPTLSRVQAAALVESILGELKRGILRDNKVLVTNFGSFEVLTRRRRRGRNPITGEVIAIQPRRTLVFRCSTRLENNLNRSERKAVKA